MVSVLSRCSESSQGAVLAPVLAAAAYLPVHGDVLLPADESSAFAAGGALFSPSIFQSAAAA